MRSDYEHEEQRWREELDWAYVRGAVHATIVISVGTVGMLVLMWLGAI